MRGAMLVDAITGERLDTGDRGVRVSHMDSFDSYALGDNEHMRGFSISFKGSISRWYCGRIMLV